MKRVTLSLAERGPRGSTFAHVRSVLPPQSPTDHISSEGPHATQVTAQETQPEGGSDWPKVTRFLGQSLAPKSGLFPASEIFRLGEFAKTGTCELSGASVSLWNGPGVKTLTGIPGVAPIRPWGPAAGKREAAFHLFHIQRRSVSVVLIFSRISRVLTPLKQERLQASNFSFFYPPCRLSLVAPLPKQGHLRGEDHSPSPWLRGLSATTPDTALGVPQLPRSKSSGVRAGAEDELFFCWESPPPSGSKCGRSFA